MGRIPEIQAIIDRDFPADRHPYRIFERVIFDHVGPGCTVLDIGCGRGASSLVRLKGRAKTLIGIDLIDFALTDPELLLINADVCHMDAIPSSSIDVSISRSVMEHLKDVRSAYSEISRVLKPGGKYIFLTPNAWDYASIIAYLVPNRFHGKLTHLTEGRSEAEVYPTFYRSNTFRAIRRLAEQSHFGITHFRYLGQYPCYFSFNRTLFYLGSTYEKFLQRHPPLHFLMGWVLCILSKRR